MMLYKSKMCWTYGVEQFWFDFNSCNAIWTHFVLNGVQLFDRVDLIGITPTPWRANQTKLYPDINTWVTFVNGDIMTD